MMTLTSREAFKDCCQEMDDETLQRRIGSTRNLVVVICGDREVLPGRVPSSRARASSTRPRTSYRIQRLRGELPSSQYSRGNRSATAIDLFREYSRRKRLRHGLINTNVLHDLERTVARTDAQIASFLASHFKPNCNGLTDASHQATQRLRVRLPDLAATIFLDRFTSHDGDGTCELRLFA